MDDFYILSDSLINTKAFSNAAIVNVSVAELVDLLSLPNYLTIDIYPEDVTPLTGEVGCVCEQREKLVWYPTVRVTCTPSEG